MKKQAPVKYFENTYFEDTSQRLESYLSSHVKRNK